MDECLTKIIDGSLDEDYIKNHDLSGLFNDDVTEYNDDELSGFKKPLTLAASNGNIQMIRLLLANGAKPNIKDVNGYNVVHALIIGARPDKNLNGKKSVEESYCKVYKKLVRALTEYDNDNDGYGKVKKILQMEDDDGFRPLEAAVQYEKFRIFLQILNTPFVYRTPDKVEGVYYCYQYDVSEYALFGPRMLKNPLYAIALKPVDKLQTAIDLDIFSIPVISEWKNQNKWWYRIYFLIISIVLLSLYIPLYFAKPYLRSTDTFNDLAERLYWVPGVGFIIFVVVLVPIQCAVYKLLWMTRGLDLWTALTFILYDIVILVYLCLITLCIFEISTPNLFAAHTFGITMTMMIFKHIKFIRYYVQIIILMVLAMLRYMIIFSLVFGSFCFFYWTVNPDYYVKKQEDETKEAIHLDFGDAIYFTFRLMLNMENEEMVEYWENNYTQEYNSYRRVFHILFVLIVQMLLLSLLIAVISTSYTNFITYQNVIDKHQNDLLLKARVSSWFYTMKCFFDCCCKRKIPQCLCLSDKISEQILYVKIFQNKPNYVLKWTEPSKRFRLFRPINCKQNNKINIQPNKS